MVKVCWAGVLREPKGDHADAVWTCKKKGHSLSTSSHKTQWIATERMICCSTVLF